MQRIGAVLVIAAALAAAAAPGAALPGDSDMDGWPDAVERAYGTNPYDASDDPSDVGANALVNSGFELQGKAAQQNVVCPLLGDTGANVVGLIFVVPCQSSVLKNTGWSTGQTTQAQQPNYAQTKDADLDGDLEMAVPAAPEIGHNFWQAWANPQQAWSGNFRELTLDIEIDGATAATIPDNGAIIMSFSLSPFNRVTPWLLVFVECRLTFTGSLLKTEGTLTPTPGPAGTTYLHVAIDPVKAPLGAYAGSDCFDTADKYNDPMTTDDERREILQSLRIVQTSFWSFTGLVFDNVDLRDSKPPFGIPS